MVYLQWQRCRSLRPSSSRRPQPATVAQGNAITDEQRQTLDTFRVSVDVVYRHYADIASDKMSGRKIIRTTSVEGQQEQRPPPALSALPLPSIGHVDLRDGRPTTATVVSSSNISGVSHRDGDDDKRPTMLIRSAHTQTVLEEIRAQVIHEGTFTFSCIQSACSDFFHRGSNTTRNGSTGVVNSTMAAVVVEAATNESMRSIAEQRRTIANRKSSLEQGDRVQIEDDCGYRGLGPCDFSFFSRNNIDLERLCRSGEHNEDDALLALKVRQGFIHRGISIASRIPIAIIFPVQAPEERTSLPSGRKRLVDRRLDVDARCMLVGYLCRKSGTNEVIHGHPVNPFIPRAQQHTVASGENACTFSSSGVYLQQRRAELRLRWSRAGSGASGTREPWQTNEGDHADAVGPASLFSTISGRTDEAILDEVLCTRYKRPLTVSCLDAIRTKVANEAVPLRQLPPEQRQRHPDIFEYEDAFVVIEHSIIYEVPRIATDAPSRNTIDMAGLTTDRMPQTDDRSRFSKIEYTTRWSLPIAKIHQQFTRDCWIRKHTAYASFVGEGPVPLGVLLQSCGRGSVAIDVTDTNADVIFRHSFLFADRTIVARMKDRRYGKNNRCLTGKTPADSATSLMSY